MVFSLQRSCAQWLLLPSPLLETSPEHISFWYFSGAVCLVKVVCEMTRALLGPISDDSLYRLHLWGGEKQANSGGGGMDEYIGRAAHVSRLSYGLGTS